MEAHKNGFDDCITYRCPSGGGISLVGRRADLLGNIMIWRKVRSRLNFFIMPSRVNSQKLSAEIH